MLTLRSVFVEIDLRKQKWLLFCSYNRHKSNIKKNLQNIRKTLGKLNGTCDNLTLLDNFNIEADQESVALF